MPVSRPSRAAAKPHVRQAGAKPPAPGTVKLSTRAAAVRSPAPRSAPPPPPSQRRRPATAPSDSEEDDGEERGTRRTEVARTQRGRGNRTLMLVVATGAVLVAVLVAVAGSVAAAWGPMQRNSQLAALDACRDPARIKEAIGLAQAFAATWGPRSDHVAQAVAAGRGPLEARIELCRTGGLRDQLALMLGDKDLTPVQRGLVCAALSEQWPRDGAGPAVPAALADWALSPDAEPALSGPALRLLTAAAPTGVEERLGRAAAHAALPVARAVAVASALGAVIERRGGGVATLLGALGGPHRAALLAAPSVTATVVGQALPADAPRLIALLETPDGAALGLAGLSGKRLQIPDGDVKNRTLLVPKLEPFLDPKADDAVLGAALAVVRQQRLHEASSRVVALIPRLAGQRPAALTADDLPELFGRELVSSRSAESIAAAEAVITALNAAVEPESTRVFAAVCLSRIQEPSLIPLRLSLDELAAQSQTPACGQALEVLVGTLYARPDLVAAARKGSWGAVIADDRRRRGRYDAIQRWISEHGEETTVRTEKSIIAANKAELQRMRDEIRGWQEANVPMPIGVSASNLVELANQVQLMLSMVLKATGI